ncbi:unnamed protein product [Schistosoma turkestanicum]|nr:unnamed protein product [Schistosoma turkestanicum]
MKETNTDQFDVDTWCNKLFSMTSMESQSTKRHQDVEGFPVLENKLNFSSPHLVNNYPFAYSPPSSEEFHYRLAYFLIRDFHPPRILEEEGFKVLFEILWNKFIKRDEDMNYDPKSKFLPSSDLMENEILTNLYKNIKLNVDNKIKSLIALQNSGNYSVNLPQITISLKFWSLNPHDNFKLEKDNLSFEFVDVKLNFFVNTQHTSNSNHIFYGTYEISKMQTLYEILKPCWNLIYSQFNTNYDYILSEWPIIILTNCSEYASNAFQELCPISNYLILPCVDVHMRNAVQCALSAVDQVLKSYQKSLQTLDENTQQVKDLTAEANFKNQWNYQANINESLSDVLNLITRLISRLDQLPHFTDVDMKLMNRIIKSIEIVHDTEKLCKTSSSNFTVSTILPMLKSLYSITGETMNNNLSNRFYTTMITYLKTIFDQNSSLAEFLLISTFLDPRFKHLMDQSEYERVVPVLQAKVSSLDQYIQKMGLHCKINYMEEFQHTLNDYLNEKPININENPIQWWDDLCHKSEKYYTFKMLASYYLTVPMNISNNNNSNNANMNDNRNHYSHQQQQQGIDKFIEKCGNSFREENSSIPINISGKTDTEHNMFQENHKPNVTFNHYCKSKHSLYLWSRVGTKFIPIYRFLRKNWEFSENLKERDEDVTI